MSSGAVTAWRSAAIHGLEAERAVMASKADEIPARARRAAAANAGVEVVSPLRNSPAFMVRLAQLAAFDEFHRSYAGFGFTPARFAAFSLVVANAGIRPGAIAEELRVKPSNVAALVNALVSDGMVERRQDETELRANKLFPTEKGRATFAEMWAIHESLDQAFLSRLTAAERDAFLSLLRKLDDV